jgi:hypothetical protein
MRKKNPKDLFAELKVKREQVPLKPIFEGKFPSKEEVPVAAEVKHLGKEEYPGGKGGKIGGKTAASRVASAAAIAKVLSGIDFPKKKEEVIAYARKNKEKVKAEDVLTTINEIPARTYHTMAEVEKALGEIR